ncbi:MAG: ABC transporter permease [Planctomycetaceae bacterium]|nr:ABC transporter permease [Planctomycetaceae bacterium]
MSLWKVAWRSIQQRALVSLLTVISMALGVALVVAVLVVYGVVYQSFHRGGEGYDLIVGAKGGREQLVLNTVFYLSQPVGNIPYSLYEDVKEGSRFGADVETAIPVCMGHTYQGFRVVGTVPEMFTELKYRNNERYQFAKGRNFKADQPFEAVLGAAAASRTQLQIGEAVRNIAGGSHTDRAEFKVVGILAPTGTPVDHAVYVNMRGFQEIHHGAAAAEHAERADHDEGGKHDEKAKHDEHGDHDHGNEITAMLVCIYPDRANAGRTDVVARMVNDSRVAQAVVPARVIADMFEGVVGKLQWVLLGMAVVTVVEAGIGIMVSIYNSMSDRRHEIAVMRALGASRFTVMMVILMESILLALMGGAIGLLLGHGVIWACSPLIAEWTGVVVDMLQFQLMELVLIPGLVVLASAVGYLPAVAAYRTDVAKSLITTP